MLLIIYIYIDICVCVCQLPSKIWKFQRRAHLLVHFCGHRLAGGIKMPSPCSLQSLVNLSDLGAGTAADVGPIVLSWHHGGCHDKIQNCEKPRKMMGYSGIQH